MQLDSATTTIRAPDATRESWAISGPTALWVCFEPRTPPTPECFREVAWTEFRGSPPAGPEATLTFLDPDTLVVASGDARWLVSHGATAPELAEQGPGADAFARTPSNTCGPQGWFPTLAATPAWIWRPCAAVFPSLPCHRKAGEPRPVGLRLRLMIAGSLRRSLATQRRSNDWSVFGGLQFGWSPAIGPRPTRAAVSPAAGTMELAEALAPAHAAARRRLLCEAA